ncbi:MAG: hypothetical protein EOM19_02090 [Candidatus Moranbacteria bacterium]|nr:hypothetical protein [Candidatus Moranbacteria bacterium]
MKYETLVKLGLYFQKAKKGVVIKYFDKQKGKFELKASMDEKTLLQEKMDPETISEIVDYENFEKVYIHNQFGEFLRTDKLRVVSTVPFAFQEKKEKEEKNDSPRNQDNEKIPREQSCSSCQRRSNDCNKEDSDRN